MSEAPVIDDDPRNTPSYRFARAAVIILGVLIVAALMLLVAGLVIRFTAHPAHETAGVTPASFALAPGARIVSMDVQANRLILRIRTQAGDEIDIIDTENGHLVGQVKATAAGQK